MHMAAALRVLYFARWRVTGILVCGRMTPSTAVRPICSSPLLRNDDKERYIQDSKLPTMHFQPGLPRLPVPNLADTCKRYLAAQKPILTAEEYSVTEQLTEEFKKPGSAGYELNNRLVQQNRKNKHTSYITDYWFDMYLKDRRSVVLNHNPFMTFKPDPRQPDQIDRAVNFIRSAVRVRNSLDDQKLEPEIFHLNPSRSNTEWFKNAIRFVPSSLSWYGAFLMKAFPLDMSQYKRLFNSTRIPRQGKDELKASPGAPHVLVLRNGHMYCVDAVQPNGLPVDPDKLYGSLSAIMDDSVTPAEYPIGYLTSMGRDQWANARDELSSNSHNAALLDKIDSALFVLCLDDTEPESPDEATTVFLHNHGANRWFDKSFQLIVCRNSGASVNFEHAWGDGVAVLRLFNELFKETTTAPVHPSQPSSTFSIKHFESNEETSNSICKLEPILSDSAKASISLAKTEMEARAQRLSTSVLQYQHFAKPLLKTKSLGADGILQLAFQIAYYRQYKHSPVAYESCSTAAFKHGRTETIRPASVATDKCAAAFEPSSNASTEEKAELIKDAVKWHNRLVKEAATGNGFDRHLFAIKCLAALDQQSLPLFDDPAYVKLNHIILSTSTLSADSVLMGGFAPVTDDGYGLGYGITDDTIGCNVTTYPARDGQQLISNIESALNDLHDVIKTM